MDKRLSIIATEQKNENAQFQFNKANKRQALQAKFDRLWLENPKQFDPGRNCMEEERLKRTLELILRHTSLAGKRAVDLGCGHGVFAKMLADQGVVVDAVDISANALKPLKEDSYRNIRTVQDMLPQTLLEDETYDLVISTEVIAYLPESERRLYFAELSRLVKSDGFVISSTAFDINTIGGFETFEALTETEFQILEWVFSYHAFLIRMKNLPLLRFLDKRRTIMLWLEKLCHLIYQDGGLSHALFIGKRRPLKMQAQEEPPVLMQQKRRVWE